MDHEPLIYALFVAAFPMVGLLVMWGGKLDRLLRERHPETHAALRLRDKLEDPGGDAESSPAMLRFLWRREYDRLRDEEVTRVAGRLRGLVIAYAVVFGALFVLVTYQNVSTDEVEAEARANVEAAAASQDKRSQALSLHRQGRLAEAIRLYDELLGPIGADGELVYWRGVAHAAAGHEDQALVDFRRVMDLDPGNLGAYRNSDRILSAQKRFDDCVDLWNRYLRVVPGDAEAHFERGGAHFHLGDLAAALADATRACELGKREACPVADRMKARLSAGEPPGR